jgi:hypothetical protein
MESTLLKERSRSWLGIAMNNDTDKMPNDIHHFSHHSGMMNVMKIEMPVSKTIKMERGIRACWMVLSTKLILPWMIAPGILGRLLRRL